ncbi:MAG: leucine--tRNA ligase [Bacteroidota bacterium]
MAIRYDFSATEKSIQNFWQQYQIATPQPLEGDKKYILDMFPYPSGAGLHIGHLVGYYASDTLAIFYKMQGYNVLHPMGFDAFGLPAEQYAVETGQHPAITTAQNMTAYRAILRRAGLSFDWKRSFATTDSDYYRWTQWIFLRFFESWYNEDKGKAEPIDTLINHIVDHGNKGIPVKGSKQPPVVTAATWSSMGEADRAKLLSYYRLAYLAETTVNWCPALGTVLANEEVQNGFSERGGYPVIRKRMNQWHLRILPYTDRLLSGLNELTWSPAVKEMQRNWIGKSAGAYVTFQVSHPEVRSIQVFTTRPDTIFGVTFLVLAPEHPIVAPMLAYLKEEVARGNKQLDQQYQKIATYVEKATNKSHLLRMQEIDKITGVVTPIEAIHPFTQQRIPVWIADYVLPHYGTGAIMAVPAHDQRDYAFAQYFQLPIKKVISGDHETPIPHEGQEGRMVQSDFLNGLSVKEGKQAAIQALASKGVGEPCVMYKLRDPVFSRQRYWGEPFPIYYRDGVPHPLPASELPLKLPDVDSFQPNEAGDPPLSRAKKWLTPQGDPLEYHTMPGWAGSSWYFLRYMDPHNQQAFASREALNYWQQVDCYIGGAEHTTGHLLYARFFTKVLYDLGLLSFEEPFKRLINQGMIQGASAFVYRIRGTNQFVSYGLRDGYDTVPMYVDVRLVTKRKLDLDEFRQWRPHLADATFILEDGVYICGEEIEKMSKSKYNTVDPGEMIDRYGADALRLHLLFLGPLTHSKPWSTQGLEGVTRFMQKYWNLFYDPQGDYQVTEGKSSIKVYQVVHQCIKQVRDSLARYSFNTCVSSLMIMVNQLASLTPIKKDIAADIFRLLVPFAPHMAEALWQKGGYQGSIIFAGFPIEDPAYLVTKDIDYPIAINGKKRAVITIPAATEEVTIIRLALAQPAIVKWLAGREPKRVIVVPKRMINVVI